MMISMVDTDGDGQVSYEEFHRLIIDPDPSRPDFTTEPIKSDRKEAAIATQASRFDSIGDNRNNGHGQIDPK